MADQNARQDQNQFPALIGHSGTAGTAETRRIVVAGDGSMYVSPITLNPLAQTNPSLVLSYDVDGNLSTITKTIGATSYVKTLTYTAGVLTGVSVWSEA